MRDLVGDGPAVELHGRTLFQTRIVDDDDVRDRDVLDLGCGFGWFSLAALDAGANTILGVEVSDEDLAPARSSIDDPRCTFEVGSALDIPAQDASVDTAVAWEVIEHVPRGAEALMLQEMGRVLRPGGVVYLSTPFASARGRLLDPAWLLKGHRHYDAAALGPYAAAGGRPSPSTTSTSRNGCCAAGLSSTWSYRGSSIASSHARAASRTSSPACAGRQTRATRGIHSRAHEPHGLIVPTPRTA